MLCSAEVYRDLFDEARMERGCWSVEMRAVREEAGVAFDHMRPMLVQGSEVHCPMQRTPGYHLPYIHMLRALFAALLRAHLLYISLPIVAYCSACLWGL